MFVLAGLKRDAGVEIPADDQDAPRRGFHRLADEMVIVSRIDDHGRTRGSLDPPDIVTRRDDRLHDRHPLHGHRPVILAP